MTGARLALLGVGVMGETVLAGLLRSGWSGAEIAVSVRDQSRAAALTERYGVTVADGAVAVADAETVLVAVKPHDVAGLLAGVAPHLRTDALVVSLAAGIPLEVLEAALPTRTPVVRVMPNTPAQVDEGMSAISAGRHAGDGHLDRVRQLLLPISRVVVVPERYQDAVTALSGSGPAYVFLMVEAMVESGVHLGLPRTTATELVVQTVFGAAKLLRESDEHPGLLRERVTSPGGTTAAALRELEDHGLRSAFLAATEAASNRSAALADSARRPGA